MILLADADVNQNIVQGVRRREPSIDFLDAHRGGVIGLTDPEVLSVAANLGRVLVSHDRNTMIRHYLDFLELRDSPGLIILSQKLPIGSAIERLLLVWIALDPGELRNQIHFLR